MMFSGIFLKSGYIVRMIAIAGLIMLLAANVAELYGFPFFYINTRNMLVFNSFGLVFNTIAFASTLVYFLLSGRDIMSVGINGSDYFALLFLCFAELVSPRLLIPY